MTNMTHKQWFTDLVAQLPADPAELVRRKMDGIVALLTDIVDVFNEVSEENALAIRFILEAAPGERVTDVMLWVQITLPRTRFVRSFAETKDPNDLTKKDVMNLASFRIRGSSITFDVQHEDHPDARDLGDSDPAELVKASVENFLRGESHRRASLRDRGGA